MGYEKHKGKTSFEIFEEQMEKIIPRITIKEKIQRIGKRVKKPILIPVGIKESVGKKKSIRILQKGFSSRTEKTFVRKLTNELLEIEAGRAKSIEERDNIHLTAVR